jgi:ELWxxDGT repeat protein
MALTASGQTVQVLSDINSAPLSTSAIADEMAVAGNNIFISTDDSTTGSELWKFSVKAAFQNPQAVAADADGNVYVADTANHIIRKISANGAVSTLAGKIGVSGKLDAAGVSATFNSPQGIAVVTSGASKGVLYVADTGNHTIRRITPEGVVTTPAGDGGSQGDAGGAGGSARFRSPKGIAVNSTGTTVFVADAGNHTIRSLAITGTTTISVNVTLVAGLSQTSGTQDGTGNGARFNNPSAIAVNSSNQLYVADTGNHTLRRIINGVVTTLAGTAGSSGNVNGTGTAARFSSPQGVTCDTSGANIYLGDTGNHLIRRVTSAGIATTLAGSGSSGAANGTGSAASFNGLQELSLHNGMIYVADTVNHTIRRVNTSGVTELYAGQTGSSGGVDGAALSSSTSVLPELVRDIFPGPGNSQPKHLTAVNSNLFFSAEDGNGDRDLWISDGSFSGTKRVGNTNYIADPFGPDKLLNVNGTLFFQGFSSAKGAELWKATVSGSTVTPQEVLDINPGTEPSEIDNLFNANGTLLFTAYDGEDPDNDELTPSRGLELWKSGGTNLNTSLLADVFPGSSDSVPRSYATFNGVHFFSANGTDGVVPVGRELFQTNLTTATLVLDIEPGSGGSDPQNLVVSGPADAALGGQLFFTAATNLSGRELYVINAANGLGNPLQVRDLNGTVEASQIANLTPITVTIGNPAQPNRVIFSADANNNLGNELYTSDGALSGSETGLLKEITPGEAGTDMGNFIRISAGLVVFTVRALDQTLTLWRTDGTESGTFQIEGFAGESNNPKDFRAPALVGTNLYFLLGDDELWRTDGHTDEGTVRVHRFRTTTGDSLAQGFTQLSTGKIIFSAVTEASGREPWITDLAGNTVQLAEILAGSAGSDPQDFTPTSDGRVFFTANGSTDNRELYVSDGLTATLVKEINPIEGSNPQQLFWHQGKLYFSVSSEAFNQELWVSDGTEGGTNLLVDINSGGSSSPAHFAAIGNTIYFAADTSTLFTELWKTDGTAIGTVLVKDIATGTPSSDPDEFVVIQGTGNTSRLYFIATGSGAQQTGRELWKSDGTATGTTVVKDIIPGIGSSIDSNEPAYLTVVNKTLFFVADDGVKGRELWKSDGTTAGTTLVKDINTKAGTTGTLDSNPSELRSVNGRVFFLADNGINGRELWVSDGTAAGTVMVKDIVAGIGDAGIQEMAVSGDVLCFTADNGINGREVWISDGTSVGTQIISDILPGVTSSVPHSLACLGTTLLFSARDSVIGDEPRFALLPSKLIVEHVTAPNPTELTSGVSMVSFNPPSINFGASATLVIRLKNVGINSLRSVTTTLSGPHAGDYLVTKRPLPVIPKDSATELTVQFKPREGGLRTSTLTILSTDANHPQFTVTLSGLCIKDPTIGVQPISQMVKVGAPVTLASTTTGGTAPINLQWLKNNSGLAGATANPLYLWAARITDAGAYTAQFKSSSRPIGVGTSDVAQLGVVEDYNPPRVQPVKVGASIKLTVNAAGNGQIFSWKRSPNLNLSSPQTLAFTGFNTKTLTIPPTQTSDSQYYFCEVTGPGGIIIGGTTQLKVFNAAPIITPAPTLPVGIVGSVYSHQVAFDSTASRAPLTFTASNLPAGLRIDSKTGVISGVPTKVESKTVILTVANGITPATAASTSTTLNVVNLPTGLDGVFHGLVERDLEINGMAGGRIELTVTKTGTYSGRLTLAAATFSFRGNLAFGIDPDPDNNPSTNDAVAKPPFSGAVRIPRPGIAAPLDLTFTIADVTKDRLSAGLISSVNAGGPVNADVTGWKVTTNTGRYIGLYNFGLRLPAMVNALANENIGDDDVPQGDGYGSFTVSTRGALSIAGVTADGERITCATHVGPAGEVLLYQSLYTTVRRGSLWGQLNIGLGGDPDVPTDNIINSSSVFDWTRPPATAVLATATNTRTYRAGFGLPDTPVVDPVELEAFGGFYQPLAHLLQIANGSTTADNASLAFTDAGVNLPTREPDLPNLAVNITAIRVLTASTALTRITAIRTSGVFSGGFALADDDVTTTTSALNNKADELKRSVSFFGLIVPEAGNHRGVGYFMLPQIPPAAAATPARTAPILSGKVLLDND